MTISKEGVRIIYTCNGCGVVRQDQDGQRARWRPYPIAWKDAEAAGWTARKMADKSDYEHFCKDCSGEKEQGE